MKIIIPALLLLLFAQEASSQIFKVQTTACGAVPTDLCEGLRQEIQKHINEHAPGVEIDKYADGMARSNKISAKGGGSDYANRFEAIMLSASVNAGAEVDINNTKNLEKTASGVSLAPSAVIGVNLGLLPVGKIAGLKTRDLDLFLSFMSYNKEKLLDQDEISLGGEFNHYGAQIRYQWVNEKDILPWYMLQWTGLQIHTGYQFTRNKLNVNYKLDPSSIDPINYNGATATVDNGSATALIEHSSHTIPLEISTGIRFLYLFSLYGGLGTDFTLSSASEARVSALGSVSTGGLASGANYSIAGDQAADGKAEFINTRAFAGFQVNIPMVRVFVQGHKYFSSDTYAVNAGVKLMY